ncbi:MAG: aminomethyl-transferring glycine dehydrogenase subunit GcvPA [Anaerolineae bacterium]|nr:aminomethyl-transferring glycine dehydrogenase subunit GcvPA [Anaerolineae bacterium]
MVYVPNTDKDRAKMLAVIGVESVDDLFYDVPKELRYPQIELPEPVSEMEVLRELQEMSESNVDLLHTPSFLGAGAYYHFIPSVVDTIISRSEFYTAYTPYQPEVSQGTLQAAFEYQTMICMLTGMDVANASHYDGGTATAEAVIMAVAVGKGKRRRIVVSPRLHPEYVQVVRTYVQGMDIQVVGDENPHASLEDIAGLIDSNTAGVIVQVPDFFGTIEDYGALQALADKAHQAGALFIVVAYPISLGLLKPPAEYGADIVLGEGQSLGSPLSFGGPYLGFFACKEEYVRRMAGRLVGQTVDTQGRRGFVLTLSTREQHIRREKATSNICTNQGLNALAAAVYMSALGKQGLRKVAELCYHKAHYAARRIAEIPGYRLLSDKPFFNEFVVRCPKPATEINRYLYEEWGIVGGFEVGKVCPGLEDSLMFAVTEMNTRDEIDALVEALREVASNG